MEDSTEVSFKRIAERARMREDERSTWLKENGDDMNPRLGRCYELSYKYATSHSDWVLVHGYITNMDGSKTIDHAWVEKDETVFDPVMDQELPTQVYYAMFRAEPFKRYSFDETIDRAIETKVYGPWHDHPDGKVKFPGVPASGRKPQIRESLASVVYHATFANKFLEILKADSFFLSSSLGSRADQVSKKYHYFMSFSRVKFGGFSRMKETTGQVTLVIDGQKLNERFKGVSLDYWGSDYRPESAEAESRWKFDENEDRLLTNVPEIKNASSYIREAHVLIGTGNHGREAISWLADNDYDLYKVVRAIIERAKKSGLAVYFYDDTSSYRAQNKKKAVYVTEEDIGYIEALLRSINAKNPSELPKDWPYDRIVDALFYGYRLQDLVTQLETEVHNSRGDPLMRGPVAKLTALVRKLGAEDLSDLVKKLHEKMKA